MNQQSSARLQLVSAMAIFGTVGIFVRYIPLPSSIIACARGFLGTAFLLLCMGIRREKMCMAAVKVHLVPLVLSGVAIGLNWVLLFESYRYTTVATATLCYYLSPTFVILASPILIREKLPAKKLICAFVALLGMVFVSGVIKGGLPTAGEGKGVLCGVGAAALYASVVLLNKKLGSLTANDKTVMQLFIAALVALPYVLFTEDVTALSLTLLEGFLLLFVGIIHTGFAYAMYFGSLKTIPAQTAAIFSYIDPVVAILLSALLLREKMDAFTAIGAILILGSALLSELSPRKKNGSFPGK
ncbi:MAG: EamA/RhaT family transporter [Clostridiales bacterium]|nr:EamA/RhaT family transporter [Clostridiales bacterium]